MAMRNWITPAGTGPSGTVDEGRRAKLPQANIPSQTGRATAHPRTRHDPRRQQHNSPERPAHEPDREQRPKREMLPPAHQAPSRQPRRHLARKQRHRGRDVGCTRIEPRQDEGRQGDERSASGKRVLRARPKPGQKEQEKHRRTMRDVLPGEKKARSSALSVQASPPPIVNHAPVVSEPKKRAAPEGGPSLGRKRPR